MTEENTKFCPFCKEKIHVLAVKCKYCQSLLSEISQSSKTEKMAELVIKAVGVIPIIMGILLAMAGIYGIKTVSDVQRYANKAKESSDSIAAQSQVYNKLVEHDLESRVNVLLNDLSIDSNAPKAKSIKKELKELFENLKQYKVAALDKSTAFKLTEALLAYYDHEYDKAIEILKLSEDSSNKFRLMGIVTAQKSADAKKANKMAEANEYSKSAYDYYSRAEKLMAREECQLLDKNRANRATIAANLGNFEEAEKILRELISKDPDHLLYYYNIACLYSQWGKLSMAIEQLEKGIQKGLAESGDLTKKDLNEDPDFAKLRSSTDPKIRAQYLSLIKKL